MKGPVSASRSRDTSAIQCAGASPQTMCEAAAELD